MQSKAATAKASTFMLDIHLYSAESADARPQEPIRTLIVSVGGVLNPTKQRPCLGQTVAGRNIQHSIAADLFGDPAFAPDINLRPRHQQSRIQRKVRQRLPIAGQA